MSETKASSAPKYKVRMKSDLPAAMDVKQWLDIVRRKQMMTAVGALEFYEGHLCAICYVSGHVQVQPLEHMDTSFIGLFGADGQKVLTGWMNQYKAGGFKATIDKHRRQQARLDATPEVMSGWAF